MTARRFFVPALSLLIVGLALVPAVAGELERERAMDRGSGARAVPSVDSIPAHVNFIANASGFQEVPAVIGQGRANLRVRLNESGNGIEYRLIYDLEGEVRAAHIHIGQEGVNGAAAVALCDNQPSPGGTGTPPCPGPSVGSVSGILFDSDITGADNQGVDSLESLLIAMMARTTYVNIHTDSFPGGEVRGQIARLHLASAGGPGVLEDGNRNDW